MSCVMINLYSEFDAVRFRVKVDTLGEQPAIWMHCDTATVSLTLSATDREKLRAALDQADALAGAA